MIIDQMNVAVFGLGHVGLPIAAAFAKKYKVIGIDLDERRIASLASGVDETCQFSEEELKKAEIEFTADPARLAEAGFIIISVLTPIEKRDQQNLEILKKAAKTVGKHMKKAAVIVFEATVFPGTTEEVCIPLLEEFSGLESGAEFFVGYSPEYFNPGNQRSPFTKNKKVVSGQSEAVLEFIATVYGSVMDAGIYKAKSIRIAEAAKVIEYAQQEVNGALINEFALIFNQLGIDTGDVLETAGQKKGFLKSTPGFADNPCLNLDTQNSAHKLQGDGDRPEVILAARRVNDNAGKFIARTVAKKLARSGFASGTKITLLGVTYKKDNYDLWNSSVIQAIWELEEYGFDIQVSDCCAEKSGIDWKYGLCLTPEQELLPAKAVILAIPHSVYEESGWSLIKRLLESGEGMVFDVKGILNQTERPEKIELWRL